MVTPTTRQIIMAAIQADTNITEDEVKNITRILDGKPKKVELLKTKEACQILGCVPRTLRKYEMAGKIQAVRQSKRRVRYRCDEIEILAYNGTDKL
ncbi:MAG: helix-turn-helix domain-containing protein [Victivallales bacterium]|nr:helix-turn-helix domain-containing protein [Victivallales bacterium]